VLVPDETGERTLTGMTGLRVVRYRQKADLAALGGFLAVSSGFGDQVDVVPAWWVDEGVTVSLAA
jgi:hypothetical protein